FDEVNDADTTWAEYKGSQELGTDSYDPCGLLDLGRTYHWRIDEVNDANTWKGDVWSFATVNYLLVDDMESYNDSNNLIYETWHDWWWNGTGGVIAPGTEPEPVRGGAQSMRFSYDNDSMYSTKKYSETDRTFPGPQDWTAFEVKLLTLYFYGDPANDANDTEQMYAGVGDSRGAYAEVKYGDNGEDMNDIRIAEWQRWDVVLADFNDGGVALEDVNKVYIGFGERGNDTVPGGWGQVYFDDIRLCLPICVGPAPRADLSGDCVVDFVDLGIMTRRWLDEGELAADLYVDGKINLRDYAVFAESWLEDGRWP
ncbi:MAG: hypothetical protein ACYS76_06185, partial [Planctomycetota bacterium]